MTDDIVIDDAGHRPGRFRRMMQWMRGYDSERTRRYYANAGVMSSRVYAVILPIIVLVCAWAQPPLIISLFLALGWSIVCRLYPWYQAKAILAYRAIEEEHGNRDEVNSILPLISVVVLIAVWAVVEILYYAQISTRTIDFTLFGWYVIVSALADVSYDLRINNRVMLILAGIPARVEYTADRSSRP